MNQGNSLSQYIIIIAIIGAVLITGFMGIGSSVVEILTKYTNTFEDNNTKVITNIALDESGNTVNTGDTEANKVEINCLEGNCTLQLGGIQVGNLPDNFSSIVETTGASGGTDSLASLLEQIAIQLEAQGLTQDSKDVRSLASLGHELARLENEIPTHRCPDHPNSQRCFPEDPLMNEMLNNFDQKKAQFDSLYSQLKQSASLSQEVNTLISVPAGEIVFLSDQVATAISTHTHSDHFCMSNMNLAYDEISTTTDLDSAIICAAGKGNDTGYNCH
jgi:hypothetical protein